MKSESLLFTPPHWPAGYLWVAFWGICSQVFTNILNENLTLLSSKQVMWFGIDFMWTNKTKSDPSGQLVELLLCLGFAFL